MLKKQKFLNKEQMETPGFFKKDYKFLNQEQVETPGSFLKTNILNSKQIQTSN